MSIKKNIFVIFAMVMMLMVGGCASGKDSNRGLDKVVDATEAIGQEIADVMVWLIQKLLTKELVRTGMWGKAQ